MKSSSLGGGLFLWGSIIERFFSRENLKVVKQAIALYKEVIVEEALV
ncbi:hypothetical protein [Cylindrospermopsis raciborskii]|nr:hypothetical protein [Cylindrospermopsis raciborskii]